MTPTETGITVVHVRKHPYDFYIGREFKHSDPARALCGSPWQNPFPLTPNPSEQERARCLELYRSHILKSPALLDRLKRGELLGKTLACWCHADPCGPEAPAVCHCHGDVLRELQAKFYDPTAATAPVAPVKIKAAPVACDDPKKGNIVAVKVKGEIGNFPGKETIAKRVIYRETFGYTKDGTKVSVGVAWNIESSTNVWFVALVAVGGEFYAVKSAGQTKTCPNIKLMSEAAVRELGHQLKKIQGIPGYFAFTPEDRAALEEGIRKAWPRDVPTDGKADIPTVHQSARRHTTQVQNRQVREETAKEKRAEAVAAGEVEAKPYTPSLFD